MDVLGIDCEATAMKEPRDWAHLSTFFKKQKEILLGKDWDDEILSRVAQEIVVTLDRQLSKVKTIYFESFFCDRQFISCRNLLSHFIFIEPAGERNNRCKTGNLSFKLSYYKKSLIIYKSRYPTSLERLMQRLKP